MRSLKKESIFPNHEGGGGGGGEDNTFFPFLFFFRFIAEEWSPCSVTCGEGIRRREVHCKIFLEFSRTIAKLPDRQCSGPKPADIEKCILEPCGILENNPFHGMDTVRDSGYAEPSLTDTFRPGSSGGSSYESSVRVAAGSATHTSYSWKENGYTHCSASCLGGKFLFFFFLLIKLKKWRNLYVGKVKSSIFFVWSGVQELIITCVRDSDARVVTPYLCTPETKPEARIRTCNDHPCPPRWEKFCLYGVLRMHNFDWTIVHHFLCLSDGILAILHRAWVPVVLVYKRETLLAYTKLQEEVLTRFTCRTTCVRNLHRRIEDTATYSTVR